MTGYVDKVMRVLFVVVAHSTMISNTVRIYLTVPAVNVPRNQL